jgi:hypothetical protein
MTIMAQYGHTSGSHSARCAPLPFTAVDMKTPRPELKC